jgi:hypothetical protein
MAEVVYEMIPDFQGQGFMSEPLTCVLNYCFGTPGLEKIEACTYADYERSSRLLERNHFILEAGRGDEENTHYIVYRLIKPRQGIMVRILPRLPDYRIVRNFLLLLESFQKITKYLIVLCNVYNIRVIYMTYNI